MGAIANQRKVPCSAAVAFDTADNFTEEGIANIRDNRQKSYGIHCVLHFAHRLREITRFKRGLVNRLQVDWERNFIGGSLTRGIRLP